MAQLLAAVDVNAGIIDNYDILKRKAGNPGGGRDIKYLSPVCAFDIETTHITGSVHSIMWVWQMAIDEDYIIIGRTWEQFLALLKLFAMRMDENVHMVFYVHNLAFEFQFLSGIYRFQREEVFATRSRKPVKVSMMGHFEFRCSYQQTRMSLDTLTKKMGVRHKKLAGELDYSIQRFAWTPIKRDEMPYMVNDVLGLVEAMKVRMSMADDNLYTIPLTSTGYVRRDVKRAMKILGPWYIRDLQPTYHVFTLLQAAMRGGDTHANRFYADQILQGVKSYDRSSSYPDVVVNCKFPMTQFRPMKNPTDEKVIEYMKVKEKAMLMKISIEGLKLLKASDPMPYISASKCSIIDEGVYDNGRVMAAKYLETVITDIDFKIILDQYDFDAISYIEVYYSSYRYLPEPLVKQCIGYYKNKTRLKDVSGEELFYGLSKELLNAIYGMMAQSPVRDSYLFEGDWRPKDASPQEEYEKYIKKAFLLYQWGVWTTAWARYRLREGMRIVDENIVYVDTDSVKYLSFKGDDALWTEYNKERIADSTESEAFADDPKGNRHYMGVFESEGSYYEFATLGAKKYVYRKKQDGELTTTIAGVSKKLGGKELEQHGGIKAFLTRGFTFVDAGGKDIIYNDVEVPFELEIEGKKVVVTRNATLVDSTYKIGVTDEYEELLKNPENLIYKISKQ